MGENLHEPGCVFGNQCLMPGDHFKSECHTVDMVAQNATGEQIVKVRSKEYDGDETGHEWQIHYVLLREADDEGTPCFDLYDDDGRGNGNMIARGYHEPSMVSLTLRLGEFVEWKA